tara:strand:+ start:7529 stop:8068 length:540 start_codon:yes stop_codon:yes gene_type:complete
MSRKVYQVSFLYNDTKKWEVKGCFDSREVADKYCETASSTPPKNINMTMIKTVDLDLRTKETSMELEVYQVELFVDQGDGIRHWSPWACFSSYELAAQYSKLAEECSRIEPVVWKILHDEAGLIWIAYNTDTLTTHLLQDFTEIPEVADPDPAVPQVIIEWFWKVKMDKGFYPVGTILD